MATPNAQKPFNIQPGDVVPREEWLTARLELLEKEKELTRARDAVTAARSQLPMVKVETNYIFVDPEGNKRSLADLFEGRSQLIVYHAMFEPEAERGCVVCSVIQDSIPNLAHLNARDTSFACASRAPHEKIAAYRKQMGWNFPYYSALDSSFNYDFNVSLGDPAKTTTYNYRNIDYVKKKQNMDNISEMPGMSCFLKVGGDIYHTYSAFERELDMIMVVYTLLDHTKKGRMDEVGGWTWHDKLEERLKAAAAAANEKITKKESVGR